MPVRMPKERLGTTLAGKYRLDRILGEGRCGVVFAGVHTSTRRAVAVKLLDSEHARRPEVITRLLQEAKAAARLKHPNVADVLDMGRDTDESVYLVLELMRGETLRQRLDRERSLSVPAALAVVLPVLGALAEAHEQKIVHRDLKPDNIYLSITPDGVIPKILDFGIAAIANAGTATATGMVVGTPSYLAPEQVQGAPNISPAADVWAMGVVLYEALTGRVPFRGNSVAAVLVNILTAPLLPVRTWRPDVDEAIARVIERALSRSLQERYSNAGALLADLVAANGGRPLERLAPFARADLTAPTAAKTGGLVVPPRALVVGAAGVSTQVASTPVVHRDGAKGPGLRRAGLVLAGAALVLLAALASTGGGIVPATSGSPVEPVSAEATAEHVPYASAAQVPAVLAASSAAPVAIPSRRPNRRWGPTSRSSKPTRTRRGFRSRGPSRSRKGTGGISRSRSQEGGPEEESATARARAPRPRRPRAAAPAPPAPGATPRPLHRDANDVPLID